MRIKEIVILVVFLLFVFPLLIKVFIWSIGITGDSSPEKINEGAELLAESAVPWWIGILTFLAGGGVIGALLIIGFIYFLKWIGEIR
ncbi:MAG: hypothetical protein ABIB79_03755 [archaeon]